MRLDKTCAILSACITLVSAMHHRHHAAKTLTTASYYCERHCVNSAFGAQSAIEDQNEGGVVYAQATPVVPRKKIHVSSVSVLTSTVFVAMDQPLLSASATGGSARAAWKLDKVMFLVLSACSVVVVGALTAAILVWRAAQNHQHQKSPGHDGDNDKQKPDDVDPHETHGPLESVQVHDILSTLSFQDQGDFLEEWHHAVSDEFLHQKIASALEGNDHNMQAVSLAEKEGHSQDTELGSSLKQQNTLSRATTFDLSQDQFTPLQNQRFALVPRSAVLADPVRRRGIDEIALWEEQQKRKKRQRES
ncbi:hypothetical protein DFQ28_007255 [Apophysomyces sp. BC1034]|nr:hypothetical protein DFQ30_007240 [Apophysomyces sp. BC1015]KAG0176402.1 hypothetical protein DFQ29_006170 [Apophysomyces sp. BC1021]KAG0186827.1 hypothetical protein DFQ28_007255 [Apophysomyces sp. BC1034]